MDKMTLEEFAHKYFVPPVADRFLENVQAQGRYSLTRAKLNCRELRPSQILDSNLHWAGTPEGHEYWQDVCYNLRMEGDQ